jgi:hypothetical protein
VNGWFGTASRPPVDVKPGHAKSNPHDAATTASSSDAAGPRRRPGGGQTTGANLEAAVAASR